MNNETTLLGKLTKERSDVEAVANTDLATVSYAAKAAWTTRVREAQEQLTELVAAHKKYVTQNGAAIFVVGNSAKAAEFAKLAHDEGETVTVDGARFYKRLVARIAPSLETDKQFGVNHLALIIEELRAFGREHNLGVLNSPSVGDATVLQNLDQAVDHVRRLVRASAGDDLNRLQLEQDMSDVSFADRFTNATVPFVVLGVTEEEVPGLGKSFLKGSTVVKLDDKDEVTKESVVKAFNKLKKSVKK